MLSNMLVGHNEEWEDISLMLYSDLQNRGTKTVKDKLQVPYLQNIVFAFRLVEGWDCDWWGKKTKETIKKLIATGVNSLMGTKNQISVTMMNIWRGKYHTPKHGEYNPNYKVAHIKAEKL